MPGKKAKAKKNLSKKDLKQTKGGIDFRMSQTVQHDISISQGLNQKVSPGQINIGGGTL
jgi:hypothetical protein